MSLSEHFGMATANWRDELQRDEWFFVKLRERIVAQLSPKEAFGLIPEAVQLVLDQTERGLCAEALEVLLALARQSDTTQIPQGLSERWQQLSEHAAGFEKYHQNRVDELRRWYRVAP